jgi:hypothetical protein
MDEAETAAAPDAAERTRLARRFDHYARLMLLPVIPLALIAAVDLPTGWIIDDRPSDIGLLIASALGLCGAYSVRHLGRRLRTGELTRRPARRSWMLSLASMAAALAAAAGVGYLIGGWVGAAAIPLATVALMAVSFTVGIRRRKRNRVGHLVGTAVGWPAAKRCRQFSRGGRI